MGETVIDDMELEARIEIIRAAMIIEE